VTFSNGEREWFFFIREDEKFPICHDSNRFVGNRIGFWRATPEIRIYSKDENIFATKRHLPYFSGSLSEGKVKKTLWRMEEYRLYNGFKVN
jgi:hypothetical protein